tara:strand:- start:537 stop:1517 length:981 start_codon:yes stop_codon:yes gene_type:complete
LTEISISLEEIASLIDGDLKGDFGVVVTGISSIEDTHLNSITFATDKKLIKKANNFLASAIVLPKAIKSDICPNQILVDDVYFAFAKLSQLFRSKRKIFDSGDYYIHHSSSIGKDTVVSNNAYIGENCKIGDNVFIGPNVFIGNECKVASGTVIHANTSIIQDVIIGEMCIIHANVSLGIDGFGFANGKNGYEKIEQLGGLIIGCNVEIGAGCTIDRGAINNTHINDGVKLDNQVHIAHNVVIGENSAIAASCAIAGSTVIGKNLQMGGLSGILGHLEICDDVFVGAHTLITKSIKKPGKYIGIMPAQSHNDWAKSSVFIRKRDKN